jgi:general secretion pathway protein D
MQMYRIEVPFRYGFSMVETGGYTLIARDVAARRLPAPVLEDRAKAPDQQVVSTTIKVKSVPAAALVPVLRPLMPMNAHLAAIPCENALLAADTYANIQRLETLVKQLDAGSQRIENTCAHQRKSRRNK